MVKKNRTIDSEKEKSPLTIWKVAFGVRFEPLFVITDKIGTLVDKILRAKDTPYGPDIFPYLSKTPGEFTLINEEKGDSLSVTERDVILEMSVDTDYVDKITTSSKQFNEFILYNLRDLCGLRNIKRYGVVFKLKECRSDLSKSPIQRYLHADFENTRSLSLRFTRRLPSLEAHVKKQVNDYRNVIYTVQQSDSGRVGINIDYQEYFKPSLNTHEWKGKPYPLFVERGNNYLKGEFKSWFQKFRQPIEESNV